MSEIREQYKKAYAVLRMAIPRDIPWYTSREIMNAAQQANLDGFEDDVLGKALKSLVAADDPLKQKKPFTPPTSLDEIPF